MKKLLGRGQKKEEGALINKTVQVGQYHVRVETMLGQGGFAEIYRVRDASSGQTFALKHLRLQGDQEHITEVQREAKTMAKLRGHPNVLRLHAVAFAGPKGGETDGFFLMDFCPATLIAAMQKANYNMDDATIVHVFGCVAQGVAHMHRQSPPMTHRDLKAENVLQREDGSWVLCDFGSATTRGQIYATAEEMAMEEEVIRKHTTPAYRAPEMWDLLSRQLIDTKVDIWALGVMLFVLAFGKLPFQGDSKLQILYGKYDMPQLPACSPTMRSLISSMLTVNPVERPDIEGVLAQLGRLRQEMGLPPLPQSQGQELKKPSPSVPAAAAAPATSNGVQSSQASATQAQQPQHQQAAARASPPPGSAVFATAAAAVPPAAVASTSSGGQLRAANSDGGSSSSSLASSRQPSFGAPAASGADVPRRSSGGANAAIQHEFSGDHAWADFGEAKQAELAPAAPPVAAPVVKPAASTAGGSGPTPQQQQQLQRIMQKAAAAGQRQPPRPPSQPHAQPASAPAASTAAVLAPPAASRSLQSSSSQHSNVRSSSAPPADGASSSAVPSSASASGARPPVSTSISNKRSSSGLPSPTSAAPIKAKEAPAAQPQHASPHPPPKQQRQASSDVSASFRDEVLGEMDLLRVQVVSLADHNKALVFRIKQLEEEVLQQRRDMASLQASVRQLQSRGGAAAGADYDAGVATAMPYVSAPVPAAQAMPQPVPNGYYAGTSSSGAGGSDGGAGTRDGSVGGAAGSRTDGGAGAGGGSFWSKFGGAENDAAATRQPALRSHQLASSPGRHDDLV